MKRNLTFFSSLLVLVTGLISTEANAFNLIYDDASSGSGQYVYDLELEAGETIYNVADSPLGLADVLNFTDLAGVTGVSVMPSGIYSVVGFDETTVNLEVSITTTNDQASTITLDNIVTLFSDSPEGIVNFDATFDDFGSIESTITGPIIPEPSMVFGLTTVLGFGFLFKGKRKK